MIRVQAHSRTSGVSLAEQTYILHADDIEGWQEPQEAANNADMKPIASRNLSNQLQTHLREEVRLFSDYGFAVTHNKVRLLAEMRDPGDLTTIEERERTQADPAGAPMTGG